MRGRSVVREKVEIKTKHGKNPQSDEKFSSETFMSENLAAAATER